MDDLGFVRNESARQLRSGLSTTVGLVLIDSWTPFLSDVIEGIEGPAYAAGWNVHVTNSAMDVSREAAILDAFEERRVQGILIIPQGDASLHRLVSLRQRGTSCVLLDHRSPSSELPCVWLDNVAGGKLAGEHLIDIGRTRPMFVGNPQVHVHSRDRLHGLEQAFRGAGVAIVQQLAVDHLSLACGREAAQQILQLPHSHRPDAIFFANDLLATGALQVFVRHGLDVPDDIAIIGYDDVDLASMVAVPLTTIRQPARAMGSASLHVLRRDIEQGRPRSAEAVAYEPELVVRESTLLN